MDVFRRKIRALAANGLLLLGSTLVAVLLMDTVIGRYFHYGTTTRQSPNARYEEDIDAYTFRVRLNSDGFREKELPTRPLRKGKRVVLLGDSMLFGQGVERDASFARTMERILNARGDGPWEIVNLGVPGASPDEYRDIYASFGAQLHADLVVAFYYAGNDALFRAQAPRDDYRRPRLWDNLRAGRPQHLLGLLGQLARDGGAAIPPHAQPGTRNPNPLTPYLDTTDPVYRSRMDALDPGVVQRALDWRVNPALVVHAIREPDLLAHHIRGAAALYEKAVNRAVLEVLRDRTSLLVAEFRVVILPAGYTINRELWPFLNSIGFETDPRLLHEARFAQSIRRFAGELHIPCLDLRETMQQAGEGLYFSGDPHLSAAGHRVVAEAVAPWLAVRAAPPTPAAPQDRPAMQEHQRWDFAGQRVALGWQAVGKGAAARLGPQGLRLQSREEAPRIVCAKVVLDTGQVNRLRVRMRCNSGTAARFYWGPETAEDGPIFDDTRSASFPILADGAFHEYEVDLDHAVSHYGGVWPRLRLDPIARYDTGSGTAWDAEIAWIALGHAAPRPEAANPWAFPPFAEAPAR